jgi:hypothetical protein
VQESRDWLSSLVAPVRFATISSAIGYSSETGICTVLESLGRIVGEQERDEILFEYISFLERSQPPVPQGLSVNWLKWWAMDNPMGNPLNLVRRVGYDKTSGICRKSLFSAESFPFSVNREMFIELYIRFLVSRLEAPLANPIWKVTDRMFLIEVEPLHLESFREETLGMSIAAMSALAYYRKWLEVLVEEVRLLRRRFASPRAMNWWSAEDEEFKQVLGYDSMTGLCGNFRYIEFTPSANLEVKIKVAEEYASFLNPGRMGTDWASHVVNPASIRTVYEEFGYNPATGRCREVPKISVRSKAADTWSPFVDAYTRYIRSVS